MADAYAPEFFDLLFDPAPFGESAPTGPLHLYSIARVQLRFDREEWRPARYAIAFTYEEPVGRWVLLDDHGIVGVSFGCGPEPPDALGGPDSLFEIVEYILPPL